MSARSILDSLRDAAQPAWPDEARYVIQEPIFSRLLARSPFRGAVLNAGCGEGLFCGFLESFPEVTRIANADVGPLVAVRARTDPRHEVVQASLTELPFAAGTFEGVLCTEVLEHIVEDARAARELARVTAPGGTLLVSVPTPPAPADDSHVREGYTLDELRSLLGGAGFEIERHEVCFYDVMRAFVPAWNWQREMLRRRGRLNFAPRALVRAVAHLDTSLRPGKPWDIVAIARRR